MAGSEILDFATWRPLVSFFLRADPEGLATLGASIRGRVWQDAWQCRVMPERSGDLVRAAMDSEEAHELIARLLAAVEASSLEGISFTVSFPGPGRAVLHLFRLSEAVQEDPEYDLAIGSLLLVDGAVPELWRRQPARYPGARMSKTADPAQLERALRQRVPAGTAGATEAEIAAAERRVGRCFPEELRVLYQVLGPGGGDCDILGWYLFPLDYVYVATPRTRRLPWMTGSTIVAADVPGAPVQALAGSSGWLVFGDNDTSDGAGYGDGDGDGDEEYRELAVDLTPGPGGHIGQVIVLHEDLYPGASLLAESLTDLVLRQPELIRAEPPQTPAAVEVECGEVRSLAEVATDETEVLCIQAGPGEPFSLLPLLDCSPGVRALLAAPGTVTDLRVLARLRKLEYVQFGPADWKTALDEGAVPRGLLAAGFCLDLQSDAVLIVETSNRLLAKSGQPLTEQTVLDDWL